MLIKCLNASSTQMSYAANAVNHVDSYVNIDFLFDDDFVECLVIRAHLLACTSQAVDFS